MSALWSDRARYVALGPAFVVALTALFVLPQQAGGFRLVKWGVFGIAMTAASVAVWLRGPVRRLPSRWLVVGGFVAAAALLPAVSSAPARAHWPTALCWLSGLALFLLTAIALADDDRARRSSLVVLVATGTACAALVLLQAAGVRWLTSDVYTGLEFRAPGPFGNPNWAAAFLAPLVPLALSLGAVTKRRWPAHAAALTLGAATLATLSKGGAATLVAGLLVFVLLGSNVSRGRSSLLLGAATACATALLALALRSPVCAQISWLRGRIFLWRVALVLVGERPLTGWGLGSYPSAYGRGAAAVIHGDRNAFMPLASVDFTHNDVLQLAVEAGLVSAALFVLALVTALSCAQRRGDPAARAVGAALSALFVNGLADAPLHVPCTFVLFFFLLGWLWPTAPQGNVRAGGALLGAVALLGAIQGTRFLVGGAYWTLGRDALLAGRPAVTQLEYTRVLLPEHGRSASQYARALARAGRIDAALEAAAVAATLRFDFDDEILRRDLQARSLDRAATIRLWRELSARFPALVTPYLRLGALYLQTPDRAAAIAAYETALRIPQATARAEAARKQAREVLGFLSAGAPATRGATR